METDAGGVPAPDAGIRPPGDPTCPAPGAIDSCAPDDRGDCPAGTACIGPVDPSGDFCAQCGEGAVCTWSYDGTGTIAVDCRASEFCEVVAPRAACCSVLCGPSCRASSTCTVRCADGSSARASDGWWVCAS